MLQRSALGVYLVFQGSGVSPLLQCREGVTFGSCSEMCREGPCRMIGCEKCRGLVSFWDMGKVCDSSDSLRKVPPKHFRKPRNALRGTKRVSLMKPNFGLRTPYHKKWARLKRQLFCQKIRPRHDSTAAKKLWNSVPHPPAYPGPLVETVTQRSRYNTRRHRTPAGRFETEQQIAHTIVN